MKDDDLAAALGGLPRIRAGADFTNHVMRRLVRQPSRIRPTILAAAAAALVAIGIGRSRAVHRSRIEAEREAKLLREEIARLKQELPPPVIALGEEDGVQRVVDLRRLPGRPAGVL